MTADGTRPMPRNHAQSAQGKKKPFYVPGPNRKSIKRSRIWKPVILINLEEAQGEEIKVEGPEVCITNLSDQTLPARSDEYGSEEKKSPKQKMISKLE